MQNALATCSKQTFAHCCHMQAQLLISYTPLSPAMWMMIIIITIVITIVFTIIIIIIIIIVIVIITIIVVVVVNIISLLV